jgi:formamidopyrimidine-DNA glycosylase
MPELPEVEVLVRALRPWLRGRTIRHVQVRRAKVLGTTTPRQLERALVGARFVGAWRRGKYLCFELSRKGGKGRRTLLGHLGMSGRMFLAPSGAILPKHAAVVLGLGRQRFVYEDTRYFGRFTLDCSALEHLGPEPLGSAFTAQYLREHLRHCRQAIKVKLLDQQFVAGIGNIYASEALFRARLSPRVPAKKLGPDQVDRLRKEIRFVLAHAIRRGSTVPLNFGGRKSKDRLFYFGSEGGSGAANRERLRVYDREGRPCRICGTVIRRTVQAGRSTFYCPSCQEG